MVAVAQAHERYKVVAIDDSRTMRRWLASAIATDARLELAGAAASAQEARAIIKATNPHVLTLDIDMPHMNGLDFLGHLMRLRPMPVVMFAAGFSTNKAFEERALELGASVCLPKPVMASKTDMVHLCDTLVDTVERSGRHRRKDPIAALDQVDSLVLVGASTGGVAAIETFVQQLPANGPPVVIAQHMPQSFLSSFVRRLDRLVPQNVSFAEDGMRLSAGDIRIAPSSGYQTCMTWHSRAWHLQFTPNRYENVFCPSVDILFASAVPWADKVGAVLLTGLGRDGAKGMLDLRRNGARTLGQSEDSCVVYGMPGAALAMNASEDEMPIEEIGTAIIARLDRARGQDAGR